MAIFQTLPKKCLLSPSTRRAWIEIFTASTVLRRRTAVALHPEGVDRNISSSIRAVYSGSSPSTRRAWIEISRRTLKSMPYLSPSTRRAWIEIQ